MSPFVRRTPQTKASRKAGALTAIIAGITAATGVFTNKSAHGGSHRVDTIGSTTTIMIFGLAILVPVLIFLFVRAIRGNESEAEQNDTMNSETDSGTMNDQDNISRPV